jgi:molecular chaperone DnaK (HSP70)
VDEIDKVIITGGGARNPYIKNHLAKYFGAGRLFFVDDIQEQVARGAALHSFIVNSFGKPIITSLLNADYHVEIDGIRKKLFSKGDSYPTHDVDLFFAGKGLTSSKINLYYSDSQTYIKTFVVPKPGDVTQLVFYIDPDQELRCEIVTVKDSMPAKEFFV